MSGKPNNNQYNDDELVPPEWFNSEFIARQPEFLEPYTHGLFEMPHVLTEPLMKTGMEFFVELLGKEPELHKYKPYFKSIKDDFLERLVEKWKDIRRNQKKDEYWVLCHGDLHLRNIMFKYKDSGSIDPWHSIWFIRYACFWSRNIDGKTGIIINNNSAKHFCHL